MDLLKDHVELTEALEIMAFCLIDQNSETTFCWNLYTELFNQLVARVRSRGSGYQLAKLILTNMFQSSITVLGHNKTNESNDLGLFYATW